MKKALSAILVAPALAASGAWAGQDGAPQQGRETPVLSVSASADGRDLLVTRASDAEPVRVPILDRCGNPAVGAARIRHLAFGKTGVIATYGKHCWATVAPGTLAVTCNGCD